MAGGPALNPNLGAIKLRIRSLMNKSKNNPQSQQTRNQMQLLTQQGGMTPQAAAEALVEKRAQIDRYIDNLLFGE